MRRLLLALLAVVAFAAPALAEPRIALVIGNSNYKGDLPKLPNPTNDAELMTATLKKLGFTVIESRDADLNQMTKAIRDFSNKLSSAGSQAVGLFFYAGHGLAIDGENWLIPVNAKIEKSADAEFEAIKASKVLDQMAFAENSLNIIILDACRNNPLSRGIRSGGTGLAKMDAPLGSFIAYSTAPGQTAADGKGKNSPYTAALAKAIQKPGIAIEEAFRDARVEVLQTTGKEQIPWESSSLTGAFQFNPGQKVAEPQVAAAAPAPAAQPTLPAAPAAKTPDPKAGTKVAICKDCPEMVAIPAGSFMMGSPDGEDDRNEREGPQTKMSIRAFSMGKYSVTRGQFAEFIQATGYQPARRCFAEVGNGKFDESSRANWKDPSFRQTDRDPVVCVNWEDAMAYVEWLSQATGKHYRLPSEAEWEYAARAGTTASRIWGDDADDACDYANASDAELKKKYDWKTVACNDGYVYTSPVGKFKPNKFGLYDMMGNARQIVAGCLTDSITELPKDGSANEDCDQHPLRGSSWESYPTAIMRVACREWVGSTSAHLAYGFRVALSD
jgi:formylglycine-generating enzyme required for sulfatase activity